MRIKSLTSENEDDVVKQKKLENLTIGEFLESKMVWDNVNGVDTVDNASGADIAGLIAMITKRVPKSRVYVTENKKSFKHAVVGGCEGDNVMDIAQEVNDHEGIPFKLFTTPRIEEGNIVVEVDKEEYQKAVKELKYSDVGKINLRKGDVPLTNLDSNNKLVVLWKIKMFKLILMGKRIYHILLHNINDQCLVLSIGAVNTNSHIFRTTRWVPGFDFANQKNAVSWVWLRLHNLPLE